MKKTGPKLWGGTFSEADILKRIAYARRTDDGHKPSSFRTIADQLNADGVLTRMGRKWTWANVYRVFQIGKR